MSQIIARAYAVLNQLKTNSRKAIEFTRNRYIKLNGSALITTNFYTRSFLSLSHTCTHTTHTHTRARTRMHKLPNRLLRLSTIRDREANRSTAKPFHLRRPRGNALLLRASTLVTDLLHVFLIFSLPVR